MTTTRRSTLTSNTSFRVPAQLNDHRQQEVLAGDWDKYHRPMVATGCADGSVRTWDLRLPRCDTPL